MFLKDVLILGGRNSGISLYMLLIEYYSSS